MNLAGTTLTIATPCPGMRLHPGERWRVEDAVPIGGELRLALRLGARLITMWCREPECLDEPLELDRDGSGTDSVVAIATD